MIFLLQKIKNIKLYIYYINRKNELYSGKEDIINIENGILKESIIENIRKHMYNNKKHRLMSMLSYNFDLNNNEIKNYYKNSKDYDLLYT